MGVTSSGGLLIGGATTAVRGKTFWAIESFPNASGGYAPLSMKSGGSYAVLDRSDSTGIVSLQTNNGNSPIAAVPDDTPALCGIQVDSSGNARGFVALLRHDGFKALAWSDIVSCDSFTAEVTALGYVDQGGGLPGAVEGIQIYASGTMTEASILTNAQIGATPSGSIGWWPLGSTGDYTDHSGGSLGSMTPSGSFSNATAFAVPPAVGSSGRHLNIACVGNSLTAGYPNSGTPPVPSYPNYLAGIRTSDVVANLGISGARMADGSMQTQIIAAVNAGYVGTKDNVMLLMAGTNDSTFGDSAATMEANSLALVKLGQAAGHYVILLTILPATTSGQSTRNTFNAFAVGSPYADYVIDVASLAYYDPSNGAVYRGDGLHLQDAGYSHLASDADAGITAWLGTLSGVSGSAALVRAAATLAATGEPTITAAVALAKTASTLAASVGPTITAAVALAEAAATLAAAMSPVVSGTAALSTTASTLVAAGEPQISAAAALARDAVTLAASGEPVVSTAVALLEAAATLAATDGTAITAAVALLETAATLAAGVNPNVSGDAALAETAATLAAGGEPVVSTAAALAASPATLGATGEPKVSMAAALVMADWVMSAREAATSGERYADLFLTD